MYKQHDRQRPGHLAAKKAVLPPVMSLSRARSWPLLETAGKGSYTDSADNLSLKKNRPAKTNDVENKSNIAAVHSESSSQLQARRLLCRHYYPEGGWGWIVTFVGTLVNILGPGLQFSIPATVALPAKVKFYHHPWHTAGKSKFLNYCVNTFTECKYYSEAERNN
ncbi:hypothetical protein P5V15_004517 [Pogonomyrmex californicus]